MNTQNIQSLEVRVGLGDLERTLDYLIVHTLENPFTLAQLKFVETVCEAFYDRLEYLAVGKELQDSTMMSYVVHSENMASQKISMLHRNTDKVLVSMGSKSSTIGTYDELMLLIEDLSEADKDSKITMTKFGERYVDVEPEDAKEKLLKIHGLEDIDYNFSIVGDKVSSGRTIKDYTIIAISYLMVLTKIEPEKIV